MSKLAIVVIFYFSSAAFSKTAIDFKKPSQILSSSEESLKASVLSGLSKPCGKTSDRFAENLIYAAAYVGALETLDALKKDRDCRQKSIGIDELFCEYFCAHDFAISYLEMLKGNKKIPAMKSKNFGTFSKGRTVLDVIPFFVKKSDEDVILSFSESDKIEAKIKKQNFEENLYEFAIYFELGKRHSSTVAKQFLFKRLMELAPIDASGDGGVNMIQDALYQFAASK
jgi:hypothetical protein